MEIPYEVVRFCSIEAKLQMSGEISVLWMVDAWRYAIATSQNFSGVGRYMLPTAADVVTLGRLVEPHENHNGFRKHGVRVGRDIYPDWGNIPVQIMHLMDEVQNGIDPVVFFKAYEEVHPFGDGNGRTGVLLFNWLNGTLMNPVWAPNFWNDHRRTIGNGA